MNDEFNNNSNNNSNNKFNNIKDNLFTKKNKYIAFFGFYAIFFGVLIIMMNINNTTNTNIKEEIINDTYTSSSAANYKFLDNYTSSYLFTIDEQETELNEKIKLLIEVPFINQIIKNSKFTIKENTDSLFINNYEIDNSTLSDILLLDSNNDDFINYISLNINETGYVESVNYNISSFYKNIDSSVNNVSLVVNFES